MRVVGADSQSNQTTKKVVTSVVHKGGFAWWLNVLTVAELIDCSIWGGAWQPSTMEVSMFMNWTWMVLGGNDGDSGREDERSFDRERRDE